MRKLVLALTLLLAFFAMPVCADEGALESGSSFFVWVSQVLSDFAAACSADEENAGDTRKDSGEISQFGVEIVPSG